MATPPVRVFSGCSEYKRQFMVCFFADILNIDDAPQSGHKATEKKGFFSRAKGWFSGSKSSAAGGKEDVAPEANGKKKRTAKAAPPAEAEEARVTRARVKATD